MNSPLHGGGSIGSVEISSVGLPLEHHLVIQIDPLRDIADLLPGVLLLLWQQPHRIVILIEAPLTAQPISITDISPSQDVRRVGGYRGVPVCVRTVCGNILMKSLDRGSARR